RPCPGTLPGAAAAPPSTPPRSGRRPGRSAAPRPARGWAAQGCRSWRRLLAPDDANRLQLARHRPPRAVEPPGDLVVGEAFHLPEGDLAQGVVGEQLEQPLVLLGDLRGELRSGLVAHDLLDGRLVPRRPPGRDPRFAREGATALAFAVLVGELVEGLAGGDDHQQPPQVVAVVELGEAAAGHPLEEAVEGVLDDVLLVGHAAAGGAELVAGEADQAAVVALPEALGGGHV